MVATVPDADDVLFGEGMLKVFQLPNGVLDVWEGHDDAVEVTESVVLDGTVLKNLAKAPLLNVQANVVEGGGVDALL